MRVTVVFLVAAVTLFPVETVTRAAEAPPKSVLILSEGSAQPYTTGPVLPTTLVLRAALEKALRESGQALNVYEEMIDRVRFDSEPYDRQLLALYQSKYSNPAPDLVITLTEPALDFALRHRAELFPGSPLLFGALDHRAIR